MDPLGDHLDGVFGVAVGADDKLVWQASQGGHGLDEVVTCSGDTDFDALEKLELELRARKDRPKGAAQKG